MTVQCAEDNLNICHMPRFKFKALDRDGATIRGEIDAINETDAVMRISDRRLDIFQISKTASPSRHFNGTKKARKRDMARYIRQLATLLSAGVTLMEALKSLAKSNAHPALAQASDNIRRDLRAGQRLSSAMANHLPSLPPYVPRLAELGEATGQSAKALSDAADRMEFEDAMRSEVRTALSYPLFLTVIGTAIVFLLFLFVVPRFDSFLGDNRDSLPAISTFVINMGTGMKANLPLVIGVMAALFAGGFMISQQPKLKAGFRSFLESLPVIGPVLIRSDLGGWARTVGIALDNGADLLSALRLGEYSLRSPRLMRGFEAARVDIRAGRNIDESLMQNVGDFDLLTIDLIRTGRSSGTLPSMLLFVGEAEEKETRELAKRLASLAEPIAILTIALIVGTIVISIVLAMTSLYDFDI